MSKEKMNLLWMLNINMDIFLHNQIIDSTICHIVGGVSQNPHQMTLPSFMWGRHEHSLKSPRWSENLGLLASSSVQERNKNLSAIHQDYTLGNQIHLI